MKESHTSIKLNMILNCLKTVMSVIFPLITFPYISRVLGPASVGKIDFGNSVISYFTLLGALGVLSYGIREGSALKNDPVKRENFYDELFTINLLSTLFSLLLLVTLIHIIPVFRSHKHLIMVQAMIILCNWIGVEWIYNIHEDFVHIVLRSFFAQISSLILLFLFVKKEQDYIAYAWINVIASGGTCFINFIQVKKYHRPKLCFRKSVFSHLKPMAIMTSNLFAITIYLNSDLTMIGFFLDDNAVGRYGMGVRIYNLVKNLLAAVTVAVVPRVANYFYANQLQKYHDLVCKVAKILILALVPAICGLFMLSDAIIYVIAGTEFSGSSEILRILSLALPFAAFASYFSAMNLTVRRLDVKTLKVTVYSALINVILNLFFIPFFGIAGAAVTTLISEAFVAITYSRMQNIKGLGQELKHTVVSALHAGTAVLISCALLKKIVPSQFLLVFTAVFCGVILTAIVYLFRKEITQFLK